MTLREEPAILLEAYRPLAEVRARADTLGHAVTYGQSVDGRPLTAFRLGDTGPDVMVTAGIHGVEFVGVEVALAVLERGPIPGVRLWVCPVLNPDAYEATWASGGRRPLATLRRNAHGVDLNRNFPLPWGARPSRLRLAGSDRPQDATYRGPAPLSEPETSALAGLLQQVRPVASVNLHSFMGTLICARVWHATDWFTYGRLCRAFRSEQGNYRYARLGSPVLDVFTGELEDWQHHVLRCWATCVECFGVTESLRQYLVAPSVFWRFNPHNPGPVVQRDAPAVRAMLAAAARLERPPARPLAANTLPDWGTDLAQRG